jgi:hypothetical protein
MDDSRIDRLKALFGPYSEETVALYVAMCYGFLLSTMVSFGLTNLSWETWECIADGSVKWYKRAFVVIATGFVASLCLLPFSKIGKSGVETFGTLFLFWVVSIPVAFLVFWGIADGGRQDYDESDKVGHYIVY